MFASPRIKVSMPITDSGSLSTARMFSVSQAQHLKNIWFSSPFFQTTVNFNFDPVLVLTSHSEVKSEMRFLGTMVLPRDEWTWQLMVTEFFEFD